MDFSGEAAGVMAADVDVELDVDVEVDVDGAETTRPIRNRQ